MAAANEPLGCVLQGTALGKDHVMPKQAPAAGAVLAMNGEFDLSQRDQLKRAFDDVASERCLVVDISKTAYIDSTVLGSLLRLRGDVTRNGGSFVLIRPSVMVRRLLDITMLTQMFDVRDDANGVPGIESFRRAEIVSDETPAADLRPTA